MAAMQELRDGGSVAMLSAVNDLYELLTFNEVMQDISVKDTEIMDNMKTAKAGLEADKTALESDRAELVSQKADLQSQKKELDSQNSQMQSKQSELNSSISAARMSAADAKKAQAAAQAAIESDELNYEAVKSQIQKLIAQAASSQPQLSFTGFICPLKSYSRISSEYGWRKNPVSGVNKLHAGIDLAAGGGTPIYAAASGYVHFQLAGPQMPSTASPCASCAFSRAFSVPSPKMPSGVSPSSRWSIFVAARFASPVQPRRMVGRMNFW